MEDDHIARVKHVAKQRWVSDHGEQALLDADEIYRLTLRKGTDGRAPAYQRPYGYYP